MRCTGLEPGGTHFGGPSLGGPHLGGPHLGGAGLAGWALAGLLFACGAPLPAQSAPAGVAASPTDAATAEAIDVGGSEPEALWFEAAEAYESGDAGRAAELYQRLVGRGFGGADLHYNLGNAYLRDGELGRAIASYRRALAASPRDQDVEANLSFARRSRKDAMEAPRPSPVLEALFFWHYAASPTELSLGALAFYLLLFGALTARLHRRSDGLVWLAAIAACGLLAVGGSLISRGVAPVEVAVVVPQEVEARTAPDPTSVVRFKLHAGTEVRLAERRDGWLRLELPDGQQGWIEASDAEVVRG